jgi:hypothetical protein
LTVVKRDGCIRDPYRRLVEPEPDHRVVGWRWAEGYGAGKEGYWLLPRQLKLPDGSYIEFEQLKRG